jgi:hypothetical protein
MGVGVNYNKKRMCLCLYFFNVKIKNQKKINDLIYIWLDFFKNIKNYIVFYMKVLEYVFAYILGFNNKFIKIMRI